MNLTLERRSQVDKTKTVDVGDATLSFTPAIDEDYWEYRVVVSDSEQPYQAVVGFPKFSTIGIGFAVEDADWNTNLPYTCDTDMIVDHIWVNRKLSDFDLPREKVAEAVRLVQEAAREDR